MFTKDSANASVAGRIGGLVRASRYSPDEFTGRARASFLRRFEERVDPDGVLSVEERTRRAEAARRAHFVRLGYLSGKAKRRQRERRNGGGK